MSDEHGWPHFADDHGSAHHDDGPGHHDDPGFPHEESSTYEDHPYDDHAVEEHSWHTDDAQAEHHPTEPDPHPEPHPEPSYDAPGHTAVVDVTDGHGLGPVGADPDAAPDHADDAAGTFPPAVDVGPLPEPVDGFPWIDTGSLNLADLDAAHTATTPVAAADLAAYAAEDLPPGADPWAALAGSDDPATSALARWWSEHNQ
jgi:hypothetical protein